jgi:hypothetical protein
MGFLLRVAAKGEPSNHQTSTVLTQDPDKGYRHAQYEMEREDTSFRTVFETHRIYNIYK